MNVDQAILQRKSVRAFLNKEVDLKVINDAIEVAKFTPSSTNMQPWEVAVVTGSTKEKVRDTLTSAFYNKEPKSADYMSYPKEWKEPFLSRRKELGITLYQALGVTAEDRTMQKKQWVRNYEGFGAPVLIFTFFDKSLSEGSYVDCGAFMQSLMLTFEDKGLATCSQASFIDYSGLIKDILGPYYKDKILVAGMSVGYEDKNDPVNGFKSTREELTTFVQHFK